jgi:hypothetical protein
MKHSTAYFVSMPFRLEDLRRPHLNSERKPYAVEKTVELAKIDYENFITDLCVDRWFIEDNAKLCRIDSDGVWHCIFARQRGKKDGVLVMSEGRDFPKWAAYIPEDDPIL